MGRRETDEDKVPADTMYIWLDKAEELDGELGLRAQGKGQGKEGLLAGGMLNPEASEGNGRD